ncbi:transaldolase [Ilumatobacter coccineus]|uniref:Transaldolase n=1 Tax=Ilumatobacter coccineus (strain NBRC 103263 / KCTC 29153 / YM16-304) TaxID=1313172 RepID=A0A6C7E9C0_ILUCY|nr:transaldolase [Ilumatobacter coccineus]BAN02943.1 transaldolase [Ilumatobacter coccineus YM16-304]
MSERLVDLYNEQGQSAWLDNLKRDYITSGKLVDIRDSGVRGLTSNPSIFQKAIQGSSDYDEQFREIAADGGSTIDDYWSLVIRDIHGACDVFSKVYDHSDGVDGYVSVEVAPDLAHDGPGTEAAARELHERINRRNLMVKIPGTEAGLAPIEQMIAEGRSINVTLIFSLPRYEKVIEAYISGLEQFATDPDADLSQVASVASFFISRVDVEVDKRLEANGSDEALALRGKAAVAQGQLAYKLFLDKFSGERWEKLAARGARVQRPLWASTSTKNDAYPDTLYVDELIGPDTVNTLPDATLDAFADHGTLARTVDADFAAAEAIWAALPGVGVDMDDVADQLEREGVSSFQAAFDELIEALEAKASDFKK